MVGTLLITLTSYSYILYSIFRMHSGEGRHKAFSTCVSHLTAIILFYSTAIYTYLRPSSSYSLGQDKVASVFYTVPLRACGSRRSQVPAPEAGCSHGDQEAVCPVIPGCSQQQKPHVRLPMSWGDGETRPQCLRLAAAQGDDEAACPVILRSNLPGDPRPQPAGEAACPMSAHLTSWGRLRNRAPVPEAGCSPGDEEAACPVIPGRSQHQKPHVCLPHVLGETEKPSPSA
ncbi:hypothetical protein QTO34_003559 [Cnephaeus nilssonii]|uniref:G-protein coupled receptors family 1 profile domain-containing protein n=1 Tax=Cnephaeus nilssonii TaxID=3371016 RepID=A0AA40HR17_CNENI|nr:hypothetical protein QTO34_003559 [Eptesicus nilssonii]